MFFRIFPTENACDATLKTCWNIFKCSRNKTLSTRDTIIHINDFHPVKVNPPRLLFFICVTHRKMLIAAALTLRVYKETSSELILLLNFVRSGWPEGKHTSNVHNMASRFRSMGWARPPLPTLCILIPGISHLPTIATLLLGNNIGGINSSNTFQKMEWKWDAIMTLPFSKSNEWWYAVEFFCASFSVHTLSLRSWATDWSMPPFGLRGASHVRFLVPGQRPLQFPWNPAC